MIQCLQTRFSEWKLILYQKFFNCFPERFSFHYESINPNLYFFHLFGCLLIVFIPLMNLAFICGCYPSSFYQFTNYHLYFCFQVFPIFSEFTAPINLNLILIFWNLTFLDCLCYSFYNLLLMPIVKNEYMKFKSLSFWIFAYKKNENIILNLHLNFLWSLLSNNFFLEKTYFLIACFHLLSCEKITKFVAISIFFFKC